MILIKLFTEESQFDLTELEEFINYNENSNFFQSIQAFIFFKNVDNYKPLLIVAKEKEKVVGSLLALIIREGNGIKGYFSRRCVVWGGPLILGENGEVAEKILNKLKEIAKKKFIYSQFRNLFETSNFKSIFSNQRWKYEDHLDILVDLTKREEELWKDVNSKRRNEIRRAEREGTTFDLVSNLQQFGETYKILKEVYDRAKLPLPEYNYFETAFEMLSPEYFKVFIASNENKIIGTMYTLCYKGVIYDWYAGSYQEYYKKYPNDLIPWKVFLWGKENGFHTFDFGGAGKPYVSYGVRDYKKKFGGEFVNYGRYEQIHKPYLFSIAKLGFRLYQKFK